jgi:branched-chain amino acid transport system substrate-binding protein
VKQQREETMKNGAPLLITAAALAFAAAPLPSFAQQKDVTFALITPLSGAWARVGELSRKGAELAVEDINKSGGIKALGGAKVRLVVADAGDSPEKSKTAAQRLLSQEPDIVGGAGAYVSSFTLAVTEVTERAGVPWFTLSYADSITGRGFKYVYQTSPTGTQQATSALPTILQMATSSGGPKPTKVGIVMDNTASPVSFTKSMREGGIKALGLDLVVDETFTPPLSDAGPIMQKVRAARPDFLLLLPTATPDIKLTLEKLTEIGLPRTRLPVVNNGGPMGSPDLLRIVGKDTLEGAMFITANWGSKGMEDTIADYKKRTGDPWITQDSISNYGHMLILKEAVERAGTTDREKVNVAIRAMDATDGPARFFAGGRVKFDATGKREGAQVVIVQWQNGEPVTVYPPAAAVAQPIWPKK